MVVVDYIILGINVIPLICPAEGISLARRTCDEDIARGIGIGCALRVATHDICCRLPVIHDIIYILVTSLELGVAGVVVHVECAVDSHTAVGLNQASCRVSEESLRDDTVLYGYVLG